MKKKWKIT